MTPGRSILLLERIRRRLLARRVSGPDEWSIAHQLARVEPALCECLVEVGRDEDVANRVVGIPDEVGRARRAISPGPRVETRTLVLPDGYRRVQRKSGEEGRLRDLSEARRRGVRGSRPAEPNGGNDLIAHLRARKLAWVLWELGDHEQAGKLFAANHRLAEHLAPESEDLDGPLCGLISHIDWKLFIDGSTAAPAGETGARPIGRPHVPGQPGLAGGHFPVSPGMGRDGRSGAPFDTRGCRPGGMCWGTGRLYGHEPPRRNRLPLSPARRGGEKRTGSARGCSSLRSTSWTVAPTSPGRT